jgi:hypothetical protein
MPLARGSHLLRTSSPSVHRRLAHSHPQRNDEGGFRTSNLCSLAADGSVPRTCNSCCLLSSYYKSKPGNRIFFFEKRRRLSRALVWTKRNETREPRDPINPSIGTDLISGLYKAQEPVQWARGGVWPVRPAYDSTAHTLRTAHVPAPAQLPCHSLSFALPFTPFPELRKKNWCSFSLNLFKLYKI